jgi:hypothetical protein
VIHLLLSVLLAFVFWRLLWRPLAGKLSPAEAGIYGMGEVAPRSRTIFRVS